jgi:hypothetical protein
MKPATGATVWTHLCFIFEIKGAEQVFLRDKGQAINE